MQAAGYATVFVGLTCKDEAIVVPATVMTASVVPPPAVAAAAAAADVASVAPPMVSGRVFELLLRKDK